MSLQQEISDGIKESMKSKDQVRLSVLRALKTAFTNELVAKGKTPQDEISDEDAMAVIKRASKQRKDSIEQFEAGGRPELAEPEKLELAVIEGFLPEEMSEEKVREVVIAQKEALGITDKSGFGQLMGAVVKATGGTADGQVIKKVVEEVLV